MIAENNVLARISFPVFLISLPLTAMNVLLPIFTTRLGLTPVQVTGLFSVFSLGLVIFRIIIGHVSDRVGRKPVFISGIIFYLLSYFIYSKAETIPLIYSARGLQSIAAVFISISTYSMIADMNNRNNNAHSFGKLNSYTEKGGLVGIALSFVFLYNNRLVVGWGYLFTACTLAVIVALIYAIFNTIETKASPSNSTDIKTKSLLAPHKSRIVAFNLIARIFTSMVFSIFVLYLQMKFNSDLLEIALAFILPSLVSAFASPYIGKVSDNIGAKKAVLASLIMLFVSMLVISYLGNIYWYGVVWTIYCIALTMLDVTINSVFVQDIAEESKGMAIGQLTTAANIGNIIGPIIGGLALQNAGLQSPYLISSLGFIVLFLYSLVKSRNQEIEV